MITMIVGTVLELIQVFGVGIMSAGGNVGGIH